VELTLSVAGSAVVTLAGVIVAFRLNGGNGVSTTVPEYPFSGVKVIVDVNEAPSPPEIAAGFREKEKPAPVTVIVTDNSWVSLPLTAVTFIEANVVGVLLATVTDRVAVPEPPVMVEEDRLGEMFGSKELLVSETVPENSSRLPILIVAVLV
jgi:hypothetical protein